MHLREWIYLLQSLISQAQIQTNQIERLEKKCEEDRIKRHMDLYELRQEVMKRRGDKSQCKVSNGKTMLNDGSCKATIKKLPQF